MYRPEEIPSDAKAAARRMFYNIEKGYPLYGSIREALFVPIGEQIGSLIVLDQLSETILELLCAVQPCLRDHDGLTVEQRVTAVKEAALLITRSWTRCAALSTSGRPTSSCSKIFFTNVSKR